MAAVEAVHVEHVQHAFKGLCAMLAHRASSPSVPPLAEADWQSGLADMKSRFISKGPCVRENVNIMFTYHGTRNIETAYAICAGGPRALRSTDGGYFSGSHYSAIEACYAGQPIYTNTSGGVVILFATSVGLAYIVTRAGDYTKTPHGFSDLFSADPLLATAMKPGCDTHYVPVKYYGTQLDYQACPAAQATAHEVVSQSPSQFCPLAIVHFTR